MQWHCNEAHHGKRPMNGIGGTVKKMVFRKNKAERAIINPAIEICEVANRVTSVTSLYQSKNDIMREPDDMEKSPSIPNTLSRHKIERKELSSSSNFQSTQNHFMPKHTRRYSFVDMLKWSIKLWLEWDQPVLCASTNMKTRMKRKTG